MEENVLGYAGQAAYTAACLLIGWLWRSLKVSRRDYALIRDGVTALLRDRLLERIELCIHKGYCSMEMREDIEKMNHIYRDLGGNGMIPPLMRAVTSLPTEPPGGK